eukprot:CAMPEP_0174243656 /NCGR_PEP_ID=MMETSP0417-20130205/32414_1 /TAXON_ID=242541 /ORGANISM="Mayorella sp, Strain BSH-02190019" /LENGTH=69 /DNA_ID=CAMNT_0015323217 /DNA_START=71 /DNA_END=280 /DNA_ORIENTATION=+
MAVKSSRWLRAGVDPYLQLGHPIVEWDALQRDNVSMTLEVEEKKLAKALVPVRHEESRHSECDESQQTG